MKSFMERIVMALSILIGGALVAAFLTGMGHVPPAKGPLMPVLNGGDR